uniref:Synembryn n=1 Tax=Xiphophorus couchianus TaxID=32473 RepID=A0A3B5LM66_9TELE
LRACLHTLRILSRDRRALGPMVTDSSLLTLTHLGGINLLQPRQQQDKTQIQDQCDRTQTQIHGKEASGSHEAADSDQRLLQGLWESLKQGIWSGAPPTGQFYKLRLLFLLTALRPELRLQLTFIKYFPLRHTVNILSALPLTCLDVMLAVPVGQASHQYEGVNMDCVHALLLFMDRRLNRGQKLKEKLTPVLSLLTESSRVHRETRHYLRQKILPPLKDVAVRPEQDSTLRGQLVRLMTHVDTDVKDCAAELLFVLCKENVSRFVKYTGYGNAAGLLAARGLLNGRRNSGDGQFASHYSSDSDSDTEEYRQVRSKINLVTGRVEAEQPNPMEGMTEEEKEEEACRLICMINRLSQDQIIQPMGVTRDGRLAPLWGQMRSCTEEKEEEEDEYEEEEQGLSSMPQGLKDKTMK